MNNFPETSLESYRALQPEHLRKMYVRIVEGECWKNLSLYDLHYLDDDGKFCIEQWMLINGYEELYSVSNLGRIKCLDKRLLGNGGYHVQKAKIKVQRLMPSGYLTVVLWKKQKTKHFMVHVLVARHFIPNPENKPQVNHKRGIKQDNRYFRIEWATKSENRQHAYDTGLQKPTSGILHGMAKLTNSQVMDIFNSPETLAVLGAEYNVCFQCISQIKTGQTWSHITGKIYAPQSKVNEKKTA